MAKRMKLIAEEELNRLRQKQVTDYNPETRAYANLEDEMRTILSDSRIPKDARARLVQHAQFRMNEMKKGTQEYAIHGLKRHLPLPAPEPPPAGADVPEAIPEEEAGAAAAAAPPAESTYDRSLILGTINKKYSKHANQLLKLLDRNSGVVTFNEKMQLVLNGHPIEGTNSVDLVNALYTTGKNIRPAGIELFMHAIGSINAPASLVPNKTIAPMMYSTYPAHDQPRKSTVRYITKRTSLKSKRTSLKSKSASSKSQSGTGKRPPGSSPRLLYVYRT